MASVPPSQVKIEIAEGAPTLVEERGGFFGAGFEWNKKRRELKGFRAHLGDSGTPGLVWLPSIKAVVLRDETAFRDITSPSTVSGDLGRAFHVEMYDSGESGFRWDTRDVYDWDMGRLSRRTSMRGEWILKAPDWNDGWLAWYQADSSAELEWYLRSDTPIPANRPIRLFIRRESSPPKPEGVAPDDLPDYYTAVRFGRGWELRFVKWKGAELRKRIAGEWQTVSKRGWDLQQFYSEAGSEQRLELTILQIDGKLVIASNFESNVDDEWVHEEETGAIAIPEAEIAFVGNAGCAGFGLHEVEYDDREDNWLVAKRPTRMPFRPSQDPDAVLIGYVPEGTTAEVNQVDDHLDEVDPQETSYYLAMRLAPDEDRRRTPAVRMIGMNYRPEVTLPSLSWVDVSDDFQQGSGAREFHPVDRQIVGQCRVTQSDPAGTYRSMQERRIMRVWLGRGGLQLRYVGQCELDEDATEDAGDVSAVLAVLDRLLALDDVQIGYRRPIDGMTVAEGIAEALSWGFVHANEIGDIYDSGVRLPITAYAHGSWGGSSEAGILEESVAAVQFTAATTVGSVLRYIMGFDYGTYIGYDGVAGQFFYRKLQDIAPVRTFTETEDVDSEDTIRRAASRRPRTREIVTNVLVESRDRRTGEHIGSSAWDKQSLQTLRGTDRGKHEYNEGLGERRLCAMRCRWLYEWYRRLREERAWQALGQKALFPPTAVTVQETRTGEARGYYVLRVEDTFDNQGKYDSQIDGAVWMAA